MRVWVTGSTGTLGSALLRALAARGHEPVAVRASVTDPILGRLDALVRERGAPDAVLHAAALVPLQQTEGSPEQASLANATGTANLASAIGRLGLAARPWFGLVSTGHVYAASDGDLLENSPVGPRSAYAVSKLHAEGWAEHILPGAFVGRVFSFTGPGQRPNFAVPALARAVREASGPGVVVRTGWLGGIRDFLDVRDVARALVLAAEYRLAGVYNVCSGRGVSLRSVAFDFAAWRGFDLRFLEFGDLDTLRIVGDPGKFRAATRFAPEISWERTLSDVWAE